MGNEGNDEGIGLLSGEPTPPTPKKSEAKGGFSAPAAVLATAPAAPRPEAATLLMLKAADDTSRDITPGRSPLSRRSSQAARPNR